MDELIWHGTTIIRMISCAHSVQIDVRTKNDWRHILWFTLKLEPRNGDTIIIKISP